MLSPLPPSPRSHSSAASAPRTHNIKRKPVPYHLAAGHKLEVNGKDYQHRQKASEFAAAPTDAFEARRELAELRTNVGAPESFPTSPELESVDFVEEDSNITHFSLHVEGESADPSRTFASDDSDPEPCALDSILDLYPSQDLSSGDESCPSLGSSKDSSPGASSDTLTLQDFADSLEDDHLEPNRRRSSVFDCRKDRRASTFSISSSIYTPTRVQAFGKTFFLTPKSDGASESNLSLVSDDSEGDILVIRMGV
ncbi:hypothetical protein RQP46_009411 [Phenoliferia psychrophenolica]